MLLEALMLCGSMAQAQTVQTKMVSEGVAGRMEGIRPRPLDMLRPNRTAFEKCRLTGSPRPFTVF